MTVVFAQPLDPAVVASLPHLPMSWTGWDGTTWDLGDPTSVPAMGPGVKGLAAPPMDVHKSSTPLLPGADVLGYRVREREVYWPLIFRAASDDEFRWNYGGFFGSIHPVKPGVWTVGVPERRRSLPLTGVFDGDITFTRDPWSTGVALIGVEMEAARPLWRGQVVTKSFLQSTPQNFIPAGLAPSFYVSPASAYEWQFITNSGDEPAYVKWTVTGPQSGLELGVANTMVPIPITVPAGQTLVVDTDPAAVVFATLNGVDVSSQIGFQSFAAVPPRTTGFLRVVATDVGPIVAEMVPLHWRAF